MYIYSCLLFCVTHFVLSKCSSQLLSLPSSTMFPYSISGLFYSILLFHRFSSFSNLSQKKYIQKIIISFFAGYTSKFSSFTWGSSISPNLPVSWQMRVGWGNSYLLKSQRIGEDQKSQEPHHSVHRQSLHFSLLRITFLLHQLSYQMLTQYEACMVQFFSKNKNSPLVEVGET